MKCLIVVRTYFSLMTAINLATTLFKDDEVDLLLTDSCEKNYELSQKLKKENIFNDIFYIKTKKFEINKNISYFKCQIELFLKFTKIYLLGHKYIEKYAGIKNVYDKLIVFQVNIDLELCVYKYCISKNRNLKLCLYEEAYLSYFADKGALKVNTSDIIDKMSFLFFVPRMKNRITEAFYFYPENLQYKPNFKITKMKSFIENRDVLLPILNRIFSYNALEEKTYHYIYVEDSYHEQGIDIGDLKIVSDLFSELKNELIIKLHPRTKHNRFADLQIPIMRRKDIPLELYALNNNNDIKLMSMYSSGIITTALCNSNSVAYFLYPCGIDSSTMNSMKQRLEKIITLFPKQCRMIRNLDEVKV